MWRPSFTVKNVSIKTATLIERFLVYIHFATAVHKSTANAKYFHSYTSMDLEYEFSIHLLRLWIVCSCARLHTTALRHKINILLDARSFCWLQSKSDKSHAFPSHTLDTFIANNPIESHFNKKSFQVCLCVGAPRRAAPRACLCALIFARRKRNSFRLFQRFQIEQRVKIRFQLAVIVDCVSVSWWLNFLILFLYGLRKWMRVFSKSRIYFVKCFFHRYGIQLLLRDFHTIRTVETTHTAASLQCVQWKLGCCIAKNYFQTHRIVHEMKRVKNTIPLLNICVLVNRYLTIDIFRK